MTELIDLTHLFDDDMPVYPGDPCAKLYEIASISKDGYTDHKIETGMHVGTHMDAPLHFIEGGMFISEVPLKSFTGIGHLVDAREKSSVTCELLEMHDISKGDIVLVMTGCYKKFRDPDYYETYPELSEDFANRLVELGVSAVAMDTPSPDRDPFPVHRILMSSDVLIIENVDNLEALIGKGRFRVHAYPMKLHAEAAPVRIIAEIFCCQTQGAF